MESYKRPDTGFFESAFYLGHTSEECSYLPGRSAKLLYLDGAFLGDSYRLLLDAGYRRSGSMVYRTDCGDCTECLIIRIKASEFQLSRSQKRILKRGNSEFRFVRAPLSYTPEKAALLSRYLNIRHGQSELSSPQAMKDFYTSSFLAELPLLETFETQLWHGDKLAGVGITDVTGDVLSSVYFFYNPDYSDLSPGIYSMLKEIQLTSERGLIWYYPGYYIKECNAMNYKANFRPHTLINPHTGRTEYAE